MTRAELSRVKAAHEYIIKWGRPFAAAAVLSSLARDAEAEHAKEDAHHDAAEADAYPTNLHQQAAE